VPVRTGETPDLLAERLAQAVPETADNARNFARLVNRHYYSRPTGAETDQEIRYLKRLLKFMKRQRRQARSSSKRVQTND